MKVVILIDLNIVIDRSAEIFSGQVTDNAADRDPGSANDLSKLRMSTVDLQLKPVSINNRGRVNHRAKKSFQSILSRIEGQIFDLSPV